MSQNRLDYQAQLSRHSHDVSAGYSSTLTTGPIVPQYFHILGPGDTIYFDTHMLVRMQDVITAFLGEIDFHIDAWFVPLQMMYTPFGQIYSQTDDFISSNFNFDSILADTFPVVDVDAAVASHPNNYKRFTYFKSECWGKECFRMLDAFNLNPLSVCSAAARTASQYTGDTFIDDKYAHNLKITPWIPAAYQCIYQKGYRNDSLERLNISSYNFDSEYANANITTSRSRFFQQRYAQRPTDYFTSMRVSPIASAINKVQSSHDSALMANGDSIDLINKVNNFLEPSSSFYFPSSFDGDMTSEAENSFTSVSVFSSTPNDDGSLRAINAANIRSLFAVDKFMRIWGRADKTYDDQILAHFGVKIPHDVKHDVTRIKSWRFSLGSTPVYSTSNVPNELDTLVGSLGQVGGQGMAEFDSQRKRDEFSEKFTAPVHGVFMIVAYAVTKPRYYNTFSRLHLLSSRLSFPIPEFDKLGAQPVYKYQIHPYFLNQLLSNQFCGWENRWHEFKEKYNRVAYTFSAQSTHFDEETANVYAPWLISQPVFNDLFNEGVLTDDNNFVDRELFHERTNALNPVLRRLYTDGWSNAYWLNPHEILQTDPFITEFMCRAKLVSWMSETGEPDL